MLEKSKITIVRCAVHVYLQEQHVLASYVTALISITFCIGFMFLEHLLPFVYLEQLLLTSQMGTRSTRKQLRPNALEPALLITPWLSRTLIQQYSSCRTRS